MAKLKSCRVGISSRYLGIALAVGSLFITGCDESSGLALSLQPSYTPADVEVDQGLTGAWTTKEGDLTFRFEQGEGKLYKVVVTETDGGKESSAEFEAHLMRLGAFSFVDFFPNSAPGGGDFLQMHLLRAHSVARVELSQDTLQMAFFDGAWLQKKIEEKSVDVSYQKTNGMLLLTGPTEEVQDLLFLHGNENEAFPDPITLIQPETGQMKTETMQLDGWKEIASHFRHSVRCVQRWERNEKLPVRRHGHRRGGSVYAFVSELDSWWQAGQFSWRNNPIGQADGEGQLEREAEVEARGGEEQVLSPEDRAGFKVSVSDAT